MVRIIFRSGGSLLSKAKVTFALICCVDEAELQSIFSFLCQTCGVGLSLCWTSEREENAVLELALTASSTMHNFCLIRFFSRGKKRERNKRESA